VAASGRLACYQLVASVETLEEPISFVGRLDSSERRRGDRIFAAVRGEARPNSHELMVAKAVVLAPRWKRFKLQRWT